MSKVTGSQQTNWDALVGKNYADQAIWFLNGFWDELNGEAENIWGFAQLFSELDQEKKADGNELDEFWSHKFLERLGETLTVIALREKMKEIDVDFNRKMSMTEYLIFRYKKTIQQVIDAPQGGNQEEIEKAQAKVASAQQAVEGMLKRLEEQKAAAAAAKKAADEAKASAAAAEEAAAEAKRASDAAEEAAAPYRAAVAENEAALAELHKQEEEYETKKAELEKKSQEGGVVQRNRAANELEQLKSEDPLPLRRAKINQQATLRKMEKAAAPFNEASAKAKAAAEHAAAEKDRAAADAASATAAAEAAEEAKRQVEAAVKEAEESLQQAMDYLEEVKKKGGVAQGAIWWMERELEEKRKYMPGYKGPKK